MSLSNQEKKKERNDSLSNNTIIIIIIINIIINIMIVRQIYHSIEMNPKKTFTRIKKGRELHQEKGEKWNEIEGTDGIEHVKRIANGDMHAQVIR